MNELALVFFFSWNYTYLLQAINLWVYHMDMISQLSDELLIRILSLVPTKHVMATCLLSKRWERLWSLVPELEYDDSRQSDDNYASFTQLVYRSLMSNKAPVLDGLYLKLGPKCQAVDIGIWIDTAVAHHRMRALTVDILDSEERPISLPSSMYTCETLETLILENCVRLDIPFSVGLPSLKFLRLISVDYAEEGCLARLLSASPKLEHLSVRQDKLDVPLVLPSLRRLTMTNDGTEEKVSGFVIDAPSLVDLHIADDVVYDLHRIEYMPKLEKAHVEMTQAVNHKFLKAFTCARVVYLSLSFSELLPPCGMIFHNLVHLGLSTCVQGWWDLLTQMLQDSPRLGFLKLNDESGLGFPSIETPDCWKPPSSAPNSLLYTFKAFKWKGYKGRRGDRFMATYLVANAARLKTAVFSPESNDVAERYRMIQDLASVATPSPWFQLFFH